MSFNKIDIVLPNEIKEYYAATPEDKQPELHADFKNAINAAKINFEKVCLMQIYPLKVSLFQQYMKKYHSFRKIQQIHNTGIGRT